MNSSIIQVAVAEDKGGTCLCPGAIVEAGVRLGNRGPKVLLTGQQVVVYPRFSLEWSRNGESAWFRAIIRLEEIQDFMAIFCGHPGILLAERLRPTGRRTSS